MTDRSSFFFKSALLFSGIALAASSFTSGTKEPSVNGNRTEDIRQMPNKETVADFRGVAKKALPAVVSIKVESKKKSQLFGDDSQFSDPFDFFGGNDLWNFFGLPKKDSRSPSLVGQASGVIVSPDGYILTNSHVVHDMDAINVQLTDGREFKAKVLGDDPNSDLALIKIEAQNLPYLTLGNSDDIEVGQWVAAIGNPFGLQATLTVGVVSAKSRNNLDIARYEDFIQTDAAINRGNSGGPLVNLDGEVIGINTAIATNSSSSYMGIGFAIPSNMAKHVMEEILSDGKVSRGFLGVSLQSIDYNLAKAFGLDKVEGALVANVVKGSPADKAGIQTEDIILKINDRPVENAAALRNAIYMMKPGTRVDLTILRKDKIMQLPLEVGNYKEEEMASSSTSAPDKNLLGIEVGNLTPEIARNLGYDQDQGVVVTKVDPNSVAAWAGLKKGALIMAVNRQKVENIEQFNKALKSAPEERPVLLQLRQGDRYLFLSLQAK
ncbi:DegQ family serine endoprotease [Candidatus Protochlamydia phocaeensis]|uniref:DegQ family serine endoprotease n=1 Tax=Candidatus Protochlamydia phocaeensis TaxID=1414722 RepID=UPI0008389B8D|nr:DegQ family serine endoprotease [Candidatus Protochlamydia phocaeensis]